MAKQPTVEEIKQYMKEAKEVACQCAGTKDFGMTSKIQLAFVIRNLVLDFHKKKDRIEALETEVANLKGVGRIERIEG